MTVGRTTRLKEAFNSTLRLVVGRASSVLSAASLNFCGVCLRSPLRHIRRLTADSFVITSGEFFNPKEAGCSSIPADQLRASKATELGWKASDEAEIAAGCFTLEFTRVRGTKQSQWILRGGRDDHDILLLVANV
jgi:hypothetical protein